MTADERKDADVILAKLNKYFLPKRKTMYERCVFNFRSKKADESFDQYLTTPRKLATTCDFGTKYSAIASSLAYEITDIANIYEKLR